MGRADHRGAQGAAEAAAAAIPERRGAQVHRLLHRESQAVPGDRPPRGLREEDGSRQRGAD